MKTVKFGLGLCVAGLTLLAGNTAVRADQTLPQHILIHMKTSLAEDDAQICAVPIFAHLKSMMCGTIERYSIS
ncbi:MAG: hypothetical protein WAU17_14255 [Nitrospirales bacterium]